MSRFRPVFLLIALLLVVSSAFALNTRSAVSINGNDANPCNIPQPCRTFQVALGQTMDGGEIVALDTGGFGSIVIDRAVTISGAPGVHAAILPASGDAIDINITYPSSPGRVTLRNLVLIGGGTANDGLNVQVATDVRVMGCLIRGFVTYGVYVQSGSVSIDRSFILDNVGGNGISFVGAVRGAVTNSLVQGNNVGVGADHGADVLVANTTISDNTGGAEAFSNSVGTAITTDMTLESCSIVHNATGVFATASGGSVAPNVARIRLSQNVISYNTTGTAVSGNGVIHSYVNNRISGNGVDGGPYTTIVLQ